MNHLLFSMKWKRRHLDKICHSEDFNAYLKVYKILKVEESTPQRVGEQQYQLDPHQPCSFSSQL